MTEGGRQKSERDVASSRERFSFLATNRVTASKGKDVRDGPRPLHVLRSGIGGLAGLKARRLQRLAFRLGFFLGGRGFRLGFDRDCDLGTGLERHLIAFLVG